MHVISRKALRVAAKTYSECEAGLEAWYRIAKRAAWRSLTEVKKTYSAADGVSVGDRTYTVFNIGGNKFRLIVKIEYKRQEVYIKHVLTHAEYDKDEWKR